MLNRIACLIIDPNTDPKGRAPPRYDVSVVVVSWNTRELLRECIASIYREAGNVSMEVFCVDNASVDGSAAMVQKDFPEVRLIRNDQNKGFVEANNQAIEIASGRYVIMLNSDTIVLDLAIPKLVEYADSNPDAAIIGCKVLNPDLTLQRSCFMYPSVLNLFLMSTYLYKLFPRNRFFGRQQMTWWDFANEREVETACGCSVIVRMAAITEVGMMDPLFFFYGDDPDWCYRFRRAGWKVLFMPKAEIVHYGGQSSKNMRRAFFLQLFGSNFIFLKKHRSLITFFFARILVAFFFLIRAPIWLIASAIFPKKRVEYLNTAGTYIIGCACSLFNWKNLLMNRPKVEEYFRNQKAQA